MPKISSKSQRGVGAAVVLLLAVCAVILVLFAVKLASRQAPNNLRNTPRGLGINAVEYVFRRLVGEIQDHNERYAFNGIRASEKSRATGTCPPACP